MNAIVQIPIAEYRSIYSVADVDRAMEDTASSKNEALKSLYEKMIRSGGIRYIIKPSSTAGIDSLYEKSPNFTEVIDALKKHMSLAISGNEPMQITPILLLGEPGLGKTHFAKCVAKILGTGFEFCSKRARKSAPEASGSRSCWGFPAW